MKGPLQRSRSSISSGANTNKSYGTPEPNSSRVINDQHRICFGWAKMKEIEHAVRPRSEAA